MNKSFSPLRARQVHLDFHTSEAIPAVGALFDEKQFIDCLKLGHVNSITLFAMCHHGWCYYDTKIGKKHPNLKTDLLGRMLAACKKADIEAPVYITEGWNELIGKEHPDWVKLEKDGKMQCVPPPGKPDDLRPWGWYTICLNSPYLEYILNITKEVIQKFAPVGLFYDITGETPCYCKYCMRDMKKQGINIKDDDAVKKFATGVYTNYLKKTTELIWKLAPETRVFHNSSAKKGREDLFPYFSHYEIESLPTAFWGYDHFPQNAKYYKPKNFDLLGMTGKFHKSWGEFGGFKNPVALKYECALMNALGTKCSIGDQLHPSGKMDRETYRIIGEAYKEVEAREKYFFDTETVSDIAILCPSATRQNNSIEDAEYGASMMLLETHQQFDMIDGLADFRKYRLIILPDDLHIDAELRKKLEAYLSEGGKLILTGESGLTPDKKTFNLKFSARYMGHSKYDIDYTQVNKTVSKNMVSSPFLNYISGEIIKPLKGAEVLAEIKTPYFSRTYKHFCSHANTPPNVSEKESTPAVIRDGNIIYIAHKVFTMYKDKGMKLHRDLVTNCIDLLLPKKLVATNLQSCGRVFLCRKTSSKQLILNLLYVTPVKHGGTEVIEDITPVRDIKITLNYPGKIKAVNAVNSGEKLKFRTSGSKTEFTLPELNMYEIITIDF